MATVLPFPAPRTIAHVMLEISRAERQLAIADEQLRHVPEGSADEDRICDHSSALESRLYDLRREAHALVEAATGVAWAELERVLA